MISAMDLEASYHDQPVFSHANLQVAAGEVVGLLGQNGSGKSTFLAALAGLHANVVGRVHFGTCEVSGWSAEKRGGIGMGYLPQRSSVFGRLRARDNLLAVLEIPRHDEPDSRATARSRDVAADEWLARFALQPLASRRAQDLSVGERRRLEVARALCRRPRWLLLDEPCAAVDADNARRVHREIRSAAGDGASVLLAAPELPEGLCDRLLRIRDGRIAKA